MKKFILAAFFLGIFTTVTAQQINQEIKIKNGNSFLVGQIDLKGLTTNSYKKWYNTNHDSYQVDLKTIKAVQSELIDHQILIFMGTWCGDSKREVPRFIKILESINFSMKNLKIVALDQRKEHYKMSPNGEEWGLHIQRVPTFIFYKNGKETNRIIESPVSTLEADIKAIVKGDTYLPNYPQSLHVD